MKYPNVYESNFGELEVSKEAIKYAVDKYRRRRKNDYRLNRAYNSYNGVVFDSVFAFLTDTYGKSSRTKYVDYGLGRSKVKRLKGEYLAANLSATIRTVNRDAVNKKLDKYKEIVGMAEAKPYIEAVREGTNLNPFPGVKFPEKGTEEFNKMKNIKLLNESAMQHIINSKIQKQNLKSKFGNNLEDVIIASECFGKVERNISGIDTYRPIEPKFAMFEESLYDPLLQRTPYIGECRPMFPHEILTSFDLKEEEKARIAEMTEGNYSSATQVKPWYVTEHEGEMLIDTYTIQMVGVKAVRIKYSENKHGKKFTSILSDEYYKKNKESIKSDIKRKKYTVETKYKETLYQITQIGEDIWCNHEEVKDQIQTRMGGRKFNVQPDYVGLLFGTKDGIRISIYEMTIDLGIVYNFIRFAINRELSKIKGKVVTYDRDYLPNGKSMKDVMYQMAEDSVLEYSSSEAATDDVNIDGRQTTMADKFKEIDLGASNSLPLLVSAGQDIERVIDQLTGINDARQGNNMASQTATGIQTDLQASKSMTYDMFYEFQMFTDLILTNLAEKTKINYTYLHEDMGALELSDQEMAFLKVTKDMSLDDYSASTSDGRKEMEIMERIRGLYDAQVNARELRAQDVARAEMEDTFAGFVNALEQGWRAITEQRSQEAQQAQEAEAKNQEKMMQYQEQQVQGEREFQMQKEDKIQQGKMAQISEEGRLKKEIEMMKKAYDGNLGDRNILGSYLEKLMEKQWELKTAIEKEKAKPKPVKSASSK